MRLLIITALAASILTGAHAAPFPATSPENASRDASNPVENTYQESALTNCNTGACTITFPATTHDKTLVSHVSCSFEIASNTVVFSVQLASKTGTQSNSVGVEKYGNLSGFGSYVANAPTYLFYAKGEQPTVNVVGTGSFVSFLNCTISGNFH